MHYDFGAASSVPGLGLGLGMNYHSTLPGDAANTYATPSATVFDAQLSYRMGPATFALNVKNLTDKQYWVPSRYFGGGQVTPAAPRSIAATARVEF
jgi:iron complex outermembrane receptor protein